MPTFDFICGDCDYLFEFNRAFGSKEHPACPKCKSVKTEKQLHAPNIAFKGSGFYVTDSSSASNAATKPADTPKESAKSVKTDAKSEAKKVEKSETKS